MFYVLLVINLVYVLAEFLFNFVLLNTTSSQVSLDAIHTVELLGRSLAAFGFTFIFWKLIDSKNFAVAKKIVLITFVSVIAYPAFYFGQERLVNHLAESSSLETREKLHDIFLLKQGLIGGGLQLDSVPYNEAIKDLPESKTFITNIPLFMLGNDVVLNYIKKERANVAAHVFKTEVLNNPSKYVDVYNNAFYKVHQQYLDYNHFYQMRDLDIRKAKDRVVPGYAKMEKDLRYYYKRDPDGKRSGRSFDAYVNMPKVKDKVKTEIWKKYNVRLTNDFNPATLEGMQRGFAVSVYNQYAESKRKTERETGLVLPEYLTMEQFKSHPQVLAKLKKEMGEYYIEGLYSQWQNRSDDDTKILVKNNAVAIGKAVSSSFLKQDLTSPEVTSIVKAMIVPPIALILSLSFGFINIFILIKSISNKIMVGRVKNAKRYSNLLVVSLVALMFIMPASLSNKYTESVAYEKVYSKMESYNNGMAVSVDWIMKLEPFVYGFGSQFIDSNKNK